jgi:CheY-like chemotaxis protein
LNDGAPTVLVVDDDRVTASVYRHGLEAAGFRVSVAGDGGAALALLRAGPFDVVVLDLLMPVVTGWEVLDTLRGGADAPPVVVVSGSGSGAEALKAGAKAFLPKPCSLRELTQTCVSLVPRKD